MVTFSNHGVSDGRNVDVTASTTTEPRRSAPIAFLNAVLEPMAKVRGLQHDFATRTDLAIAAGLRLKARTILHLRGLSETREYLITRYDPGLSAASQLNRLAATLEEVAEKVATLIKRREVSR
jgi:hypothetical protein